MKQARKTPTVEQKQWMKENGYTEKQMDAFWAENIESNPIVRNLNSHGMSWRDMNISVVSKLPTQKERDLEAKKKKEIEERQKAEAEAKAKAEKEYYREHFEEIMVKKILDGEKLSEKELRKITGFEIDREEGENRRWSRTVTSILHMCGRYFALVWEEGLTEYQDNEYYNQPYEVVKKTYQKTITVTEWVEVSNEVH
jgi:integrase